MLHLYQSNRLETLAELLHGVLAMPPRDVYAREMVIVQARGMGRWLSLRIAERFGVCANIDFPLPASFLWRLTEDVLGPQSRRGPFGVDDLAWRLHVMLTDPPAALSSYLAGGEERRRWRLAKRLAALFDSYLVYRPDWLELWERGQLCKLGPDESWQAELWRRLAVDRSSPHRADLMRRLIQALRGDVPLNLPERVVVFGISSLPPVLLDVLHALATRCDVCLFVLNPSSEAWRDVDRRALANTPGERLLASWGAQGRDFLDHIAAESALHDLFFANEPVSLLQTLQEAVRHLLPIEQPLFDDGSLQVHACHGPLRQVETLKDVLLACLRDDPSLQADDVVVLCPDIERYAPHIEAVFSQSEPHLPFAVADRGGIAASPVLASFIALLKVPDGEWAVGDILSLLENPALAAQFGLTEKDLPLLRAWVTQAGIRRGREGDAFSWQAGIGRLMLGVVMPASLADAGVVFAGLHPNDDLDLRFAERIAGLAKFVRTLAYWQDKLAQPRTLADWSALLLAWADQWFGVDEVVDPSRERLRLALVGLAELAERSAVTAAIGRAAVCEWLEAELEDSSGAGGFLTGGITFAQLVPMRNIPFRIVAVLGLNDGAFPREQRPDGFDLAAQHPRAGDRSRRLDDRWLFLETLLAARDALLLFYTGRDARSDVELPPSTVIADLLDVIADAGTPEIAATIVKHHPLQPFSPRRFTGDAATPSFDVRWANIARHAGRGDGQPTALHGFATGRPVPSVSSTQPAEDTPHVLPLTELIEFACNPARWFLQGQGIRFEWADELPESREPFALSHYDHRHLLNLANDRADDADYLVEIGRAAGVLPVGEVGKLLAQRAAASFAPALAQWREIPHGEQDIDLHIGGYRIIGRLIGLGDDGLVLRQPGPLWASARLAAWLRHLALCASGSGVTSQTRLIGLSETAHYQSPGDAIAQLAAWLDYYHACHTTPPVLFPRAGFAFAEALLKKGDESDEALAEAQSKAALAWQDEGAYEANYALWRGYSPIHDERFAVLAHQLLVPLVRAESKGATS